MSFVYILKCCNNSYYIGSTNNLNRRLVEHNLGKTKSTRNLRPVELVFSQSFELLTKARRIELKLKKFKNRNILERIIESKVISLGS